MIHSAETRCIEIFIKMENTETPSIGEVNNINGILDMELIGCCDRKDGKAFRRFR